jgi:hypothetical protein
MKGEIKKIGTNVADPQTGHQCLDIADLVRSTLVKAELVDGDMVMEFDDSSVITVSEKAEEEEQS